MKKNNKHIMLIILLMILSISIQTTMALIITEPQSIKNTFKPFRYAMNDLLVTKTIEHSYGESYKVPEELAFDFDINLGQNYANYKFVTTQGEKTTNEQGIMTVSLKPGETIYVEDVEEGTKVTVTELQNKPGFTIKDVSVTKDGTISSDETLVIDYTNVYKALPAKTTNISLTGTKVLEGREWQEGDTFAFTLEYQAKNGEWLPLATKTVTYNAENTEYNKFSFNEDFQVLEFNELGTQSFRITEIQGSLENVDYDKTVNYFNLVTSDNTMDGQIDIEEVNGYQNITVTEQEGTYNLDVIFNNTYEKILIEDLNLKLDVLNTILNTGDYELSPEGFEFVLVNTDTNEEIKLKTNAEGKLTFDLNYNENDIGKTFNYILKVVNDGKENVTYSDKEYNISIKVDLNENNELFQTIYVDNVETTETTFEFEQIYDKKEPVLPPEDITLDINIDNIVNNTGDKQIGPEGFEFILENTTTQEKKSTESNKSGDAKFTITYTEDDIGKTYTYELTQKCKDIEGLTCSENKYTIEVTIELTEDNKLIANTKVNNKEVDKVNTTFENTYHVIIIEDINVDLVIKNTVDNTGKYSIGPENFEFILVNEETGEIQKTVTDKEGNANFNLVFTEEDIGKTYQYNLSIVEGKIEGLKYSNQTYDVKITISLNEDNDLVATIFVNGKEVSSVLAEFLNIYHIEPEQPTLPPTVDTTNNIPYITMMIISGGGLLLIMFLYNSKQNQYAFATATDITRIVPVTDYQEPDIKKHYSKKEKAAMTSDEIYDMIVSKRKKKTTKK